MDEPILEPSEAPPAEHTPMLDSPAVSPPETEPVTGTVPEVQVAPVSEPEVIESSSVEQISEPVVVEAPSKNAPASAPAPAQASTQSTKWSDSNRTHAKTTLHKRTEDRLEKIVAFARGKPLVTNDMIEKLLHVSDATANRYLNMLVVRAKLRREGKGRGVRYRVV